MVPNQLKIPSKINRSFYNFYNNKNIVFIMALKTLKISYYTQNISLEINQLEEYTPYVYIFKNCMPK